MVISMSTVVATRQGNFLSNCQHILPARPLDLTTWLKNLPLEDLHPTCHFTVFYLNTNSLPIPMLSNSYRIYHNILYFYTSLLYSIFNVRIVSPTELQL